MLIFLVGTLFSFHWRGDMDDLCSRHVPQFTNNDYVVRRHVLHWLDILRQSSCPLWTVERWATSGFTLEGLC
ncbi:unnamed protein product [Penicillium nalgiovense]|uniref:Uncharacterized protein n=1 Tax=Penicillium nalgiovense TaxID=60175 RepID=A0A9W4I3J2_PENNA|nr:unnamed protein product [Penicillium nalgiovense]